MDQVGRNLLFYARYWDEMEMLYGDEDYALLAAIKIKNEDRERLKEQINQVGDDAGREAHELLADIIEQLQQRLQKKRYSYQRIKHRRSWEDEIYVWPADFNNPRRATLGVFIDSVDNSVVIRSYVWTRGGRAAAERVRDLVQGQEVLRPYNAVGLGDVKLPKFNLNAVVSVKELIDNVERNFDHVFQRLNDLWKVSERDITSLIHE